uniref:Uncharacterized protein n=1 Tax=Salvator merianae TaxID=96440 RepID=A0A8D0KIU4_SALMN
MASQGKLIAMLDVENMMTGFFLGGIRELSTHCCLDFLEGEQMVFEIEETLWGFLGVKMLASFHKTEIIHHAVFLQIVWSCSHLESGKFQNAR